MALHKWIHTLTKYTNNRLHINWGDIFYSSIGKTVGILYQSEGMNLICQKARLKYQGKTKCKRGIVLKDDWMNCSVT